MIEKLIFWWSKIKFMGLWPWRRRYKIMDFDHTLDHALSTRCSISRFGDGELGFALTAAKFGHTGSAFQKTDEQLCNRLLQILQDTTTPSDKIMISMVGFPLNLGCREFKRSSKVFWYYVGQYYAKKLCKVINMQRTYGEAAFTRFYISYKDKSGAQARFARIKQLWNNDDLLIVEGEKSRLGVGNDIFDNAKSIRRILCPATDAFSSYDEILDIVKKEVKPTDTIVLALGQTATVLAYDLALAGYRALDLGHIDIEYEWMRMGATTKVPIPGKFTNEAAGGNVVSDVDDSDYKSQIITIIK